MNIGADKISVIHGGRVLFKDVSFQVSPGDKIGLIGKNGAGKSTLLKLLAGINEADEGIISRSKELNIGYLPQEMTLPEGKTVFDEAGSAFQKLHKLNEEMENIASLLAEREDYESKEYLDLIHEQSEISDKLNREGWYEISMKVEKVLLGLGFLNTDFQRLTSEFSGGWRMRIELAKILLRNPDLLLLDEPTNHLDIESIQWLEQFLTSVNVSIVLISHDIAFLNKVTNRTIEISNSKIIDMPLPYSKFIDRVKEMKETMLASQKNQQKKIKETEDFINRFRAKNTKAKQVQSRIKMLDRMDIIELEEEDNSSMRIRFPDAPRSGKVTIELEKVNKSFDNNHVIKDLSLLIGRGEKVAFIGKNGAGKTTLSRMIVGDTSYEGKIALGHQVKLGYYAQDQSDTMDENQDVFGVVDGESKDITQTQLRTLLGAFLFSGDDQYKKVKVLSGGEKARLALCRLLLTPVNFLVLDEPTNHLDIQSKRILKDALKNYAGTLIIVSHDREFLSGLTEKIFEFSENGVREFIGDIDDYLKSKNIQGIENLVAKTKQEKKKVKDEQPKSNQIKRDAQKKQKRLQNKVSKLESEISSLEEQIKEINSQISASSDYNAELINSYQELNSKLEETMRMWEKFSMELESFDPQE